MKTQFLFISLLGLLISCTSKVREEGYIGTWNYTVEDAPFGFQRGKVIFYEEGDSTRAKLKIYGLSMHTENLVIDGTKVSFTTQVEHEDISIKLELVNDSLKGLVQGSDLIMPISMLRKRRNRVEKETFKQNRNKIRGKELTTGRVLLSKELEEVSEEETVNDKVHTFYYGWYGNPEVDGDYKAWNHQVIPHWIDSTWNQAGNYPGGENIGANFYPQLGSYSSNSAEIISTHMRQIRDAGIGVVAISWWGQGHQTDQSVHTLLDTAQSYGLKLAFHIEPSYNNADQFKENMEYISTNYLNHPAIYKVGGKPFYYLYNSFQLKYEEWQSLLNPDSMSSLRNTSLDGVFIGLWTTRFDGEFAVRAGFDGFYTYFASDGFAYGSTTSNWPEMSDFARENNLIYIPSVGPGYLDTRIRPWNHKNTKSRDGGSYYEKMFESAMLSHPDFISITSFNEWHEGTQIEPAIPKKLPGYTYEDYGKGTNPLFYISKTKELITQFETLGQKQ